MPRGMGKVLVGEVYATTHVAYALASVIGGALEGAGFNVRPAAEGGVLIVSPPEGSASVLTVRVEFEGTGVADLLDVVRQENERLRHELAQATHRHDDYY